MAIPRVFISSTFYDLKQVREDLERFIRELGYDPVRHEAGNIPYGKEEKPEKYAYREVELCDILVSIIGNRYGTESSAPGPYSISQQELRTAIEKGIQVFIFIEKGVSSEYNTYKLNKGNKEIKYGFVDDVRIYQFIEEIYALPNNNPIATFETSKDIINQLQLQWAGLFQRFLQEQQRMSELRILDEMKTVASTLKDLVDYFTASGNDKDEAIQSILTINHPAFRRFAELTNTKYRVMFTDEDELRQWLESRGFELEEMQQIFGVSSNELTDYQYKHNKNIGIKFLKENIFNAQGKLKIYSANEWNDEWVIKYDNTDENEIPF
jgi:hypothetical protein